jgi:hypothetical protein
MEKKVEDLSIEQLNELGYNSYKDIKNAHNVIQQSERNITIIDAELLRRKSLNKGKENAVKPKNNI